MTSQERKLRAQIASHTRWAQTQDRTKATDKARLAALDRFEKQVDPEGKLSPEERAKRAAHARKAHFLKMSSKSAKVRRSRALSKRGKKAKVISLPVRETSEALIA